MGSKKKKRKPKDEKIPLKVTPKTPFGVCLSCETPLGLPGGFSGTDLCGPCCCGEAELLSGFGIEW